MHCLENLLLILAARVKDGDITANELTDRLIMFASASHWYGVPDFMGGEQVWLAELNEEWNKKYQHLMVRKD